MKPHAKRSSSIPFTPQQALILLLVAVLVLALLGLGFVFLISPQLSGAAAPTQFIPSPEARPTTPLAQAQPPTDTPQSIPTPQPENTLAPTPLPPPPPADCAPKDTEILLGRVVTVLDGDLIEVEIDGSRVLVKYAGINAPPLLSGLSGNTAWQYNSALVGGQTVVLVKDMSDVDADGSLLRYVFVGDRFANYELVRLGHASRVDSPDQACAGVLREAEEAARAGSLGLWAPTPIPTATFVPTVALDPGSQAACDCSIRWECSDFAKHNQAQACFNDCNDYNSRLDEDHDGLACEELP